VEEETADGRERIMACLDREDAAVRMQAAEREPSPAPQSARNALSILLQISPPKKLVYCSIAPGSFIYPPYSDHD
jgi:hypothetical protein